MKVSRRPRSERFRIAERFEFSQDFRRVRRQQPVHGGVVQQFAEVSPYQSQVQDIFTVTRINIQFFMQIPFVTGRRLI